MSKLISLVSEVSDLNTKMNAAVVEVLKDNGGFIRTDTFAKENKDKHLMPLYVISMDGDDEPNTEKRILAVALFGEDEVAVLPARDGAYTKETLEGMTDQEILDLDTWEFMFNGYVLQNATLTSICEGLEQYIKK